MSRPQNSEWSVQTSLYICKINRTAFNHVRMVPKRKNNNNNITSAELARDQSILAYL